MVVILIGCSNGEKGDAVIQETTLNDFEKNLTELYGGVSFIHDIELLNDQVDEVELFIDIYKNGEFVETVSEMTSQVTNGKFNTVFIKTNLNENEEQWVSAVMTEDGYTSVDSLIAKSEFQSSAWGGISNEKSLKIGKKYPIATVVCSDKDSIGIIDDLSTDDALKRQTDYEEVYIFSIQLK